MNTDDLVPVNNRVCKVLGKFDYPECSTEHYLVKFLVNDKLTLVHQDIDLDWIECNTWKSPVKTNVIRDLYG